MPRYFIHNGTNKEGPFEKAELRAKYIKPNTPVWCEGMTDWADASMLDDLKDLFVTPPPFGSGTPPPLRPSSGAAEKEQPHQKSDRRIGRVLQFIGLAGVLGIGGFVFSEYWKSTTSSDATYHEQVMTVEEIENSDPTRFLEASGTWNENFWGNKLKVHGTVKNSATVATYKDIVIRVTYYSETRTVLSSEDFVLYKFVPPNHEVTFEWTLNRPDACKKLGWDVVQASPTSSL